MRFETPPGKRMQADVTHVRRGCDPLIALVATMVTAGTLWGPRSTREDVPERWPPASWQRAKSHWEGTARTIARGWGVTGQCTGRGDRARRVFIPAEHQPAYGTGSTLSAGGGTNEVVNLGAVPGPLRPFDGRHARRRATEPPSAASSLYAVLSLNRQRCFKARAKFSAALGRFVVLISRLEW